MDNRPIGVFDSGVGGLTVAAEIMKVLPDERIIYFGDTARVPYGSKSKETITKFSRQTVNFLAARNVKMIIIACNTISSNSYDTLKAEYAIPMLEVIRPGVRACLAATRNNVVGVIGTESTIASGAYEKMLSTERPGIKVYSKACPLFVPLAEEGWSSTAAAELTAEEYLREIVEKGIDSIVLGCTHYPLLYGCIQKAVGNGVRIVDPAGTAALDARDFLAANDAFRNESGAPEHLFYVSDNTEKFQKISRLALGCEYAAQKADVDV